MEQIFHGFNNFGTALGAYLLMILFTLFMDAFTYNTRNYCYPIIFNDLYIIVDDSSIGAMEAIDKSKKMMDGYKWKYFCLGLRFFGWACLCILTLGIGFLWLMPYMQVSMAKFYDDVKANSMLAGVHGGNIAAEYQ